MSDASGPHIYVAFHDAPADGSFANQLAKDLTAAGARVSALDDGPNAPADARALLADTSAQRALVILVSPQSVAAQWILSAVSVARQALASGQLSGIIALTVAPTDEQALPAAWRSLPRLDAVTDYAAARDALLTALGLSSLQETPTGAWDWDEDIAQGVDEAYEARERNAPFDGAEQASSGSQAPIPEPTSPFGSGAGGGLGDSSAWASRGDDRPPAPPAQPAPSPKPEAPGSAPYIPSAPWPDAPAPAPAPALPATSGYGQPAPWPEPGRAPAPTTGEYDSLPPTLPGGRSAASQPLTALERVAFASYYPKETQPGKTIPLLVYLALDEAGALAKVAAQAAERLAGRLDQYRPATAEDRLTMRRGTKLRIVPTIPGFRVNPQWMDVTWDEDAQQHEFSVRAESAPEDQAVVGAVRVYQGLTLRAEIPLSIFVTRAAGAARTPTDFASAIARAYRKVFASYSHQDTPVVESCEAAAQALGDRYLRDVITLQSGQQWNQRLMQMIVEADVFQLFWSRNAAASPAVREEWTYALTLQNIRPGFIRPVYWTPSPYNIPRELSPYHFEPLDLSALGWGPMRRFFYNMRVG